MKYTKGQKWDDGCTYNCECLDDMTGQYKCVERYYTCVNFYILYFYIICFNTQTCIKYFYNVITFINLRMFPTKHDLV